MEKNARMVIAALVIIFGGNAGNIIDSFNPKNYRPDPFTGLDAAKLKADMLLMVNSHLLAEQREFEKLRMRLSQCEFRLDRPPPL